MATLRVRIDPRAVILKARTIYTLAEGRRPITEAIKVASEQYCKNLLEILEGQGVIVTPQIPSSQSLLEGEALGALAKTVRRRSSARSWLSSDTGVVNEFAARASYANTVELFTEALRESRHEAALALGRA